MSQNIELKRSLDCLNPKVINSIHKKCLKREESKTIKTPKVVAVQTKSFLPGKEVVQLTTVEGTRMMLIPSKEKNIYPLKLEPSELERLKKKAVHLTEKEKLKLFDEWEKEKQRLEEESAERKEKLQQFMKRGEGEKDTKLSMLEQEAKDKANYLLKRAWELKQEQEDEVKAANSLILKTKCQAIRDAQVAERNIIKEEELRETKRLEQMMEDDRLRALDNEAKKAEKQKVEKEKYVSQLNVQAKERELARQIEAGKRAEDAKRVKEAYFQVLKDELEQQKEIERQKMQLREDLNSANEQLRKAQDVEREEARQADLKVQEYMRQKAEREEELEREMVEARRKRELEIARIRDKQEQASDMQSVADEMAAVRRQEDYEREWRRKEKEAAIKRKKEIEDLVTGREKQLLDQRRYTAFELQRDKRDFEKVLRVQLEQQEKERLMEIKRKHGVEMYREAILKQINEKEKERIEDRQKKFEEGLAIKLEAAKREMNMKTAMINKITDLRQNKVPDHYVSMIEKQLKLKE